MSLQKTGCIGISEITLCGEWIVPIDWNTNLLSFMRYPPVSLFTHSLLFQVSTKRETSGRDPDERSTFAIEFCVCFRPLWFVSCSFSSPDVAQAGFAGCLWTSPATFREFGVGLPGRSAPSIVPAPLVQWTSLAVGWWTSHARELTLRASRLSFHLLREQDSLVSNALDNVIDHLP